jgi:glucose-6-phosphate dehydrogenase assembly protein OpcA
MAFDSSALGLPVELNQVSSTLNSLWSNPEQRTRACLLNLVVYCQSTQHLKSNTELISKFVRNHACRAILLGDIPAPNEPKASAWIQAHCHITKAGAAQEICSEQITLLAEGLSQNTVANMIMANLDYDLPLNLWWQGELPRNTESPLWQRVDRLIIDSLDWKNPKQELQRLSGIRQQFGSRMALADLNWTRTLSLRQAVALSFDTRALLGRTHEIDSVEIHHASDSKLTAILLACWFSAQLSWELVEKSGDSVCFKSLSGGNVGCRLIETPCQSIGSVKLRTGDAQLELERESNSCLLNATVVSPDGTTTTHFPAGSSDLIGLLNEEMISGAQHKVYLKALKHLSALLS